MAEKNGFVFYLGFKYTVAEWEEIKAKWDKSYKARCERPIEQSKPVEEAQSVVTDENVVEEEVAELKYYVNGIPLVETIETVEIVATPQMATSGFRSTEENVKIRRYSPGSWY